VTTYALLVGIDAYLPPLTPLYGCRNDIAALETYLRARAAGTIEVQTLLDADATRDTIVAGFRDHLGRAGPGDVAIFVYCGHGSEEPAPAAIADLEPSGRIQTILLHDCGRRIDGKLRRALADKELSLLIAELAAKGGHVVTVLDCCHSGGGTRDPFTRPRGWVARPDDTTAADRDVVLALAAERPPSEFLPGALDHWSAPRGVHVALAACRSDETAKEQRVGDVNRGAFSVALVDALGVLGMRTTYRSLLATVRSRVERTADEQRPELFPVDVGGLADSLFLDGAIVPVAPSFTVSRGTDGWEVDAGIVHGLRDPVGDESFVLACADDSGTAAGMVRVTHVEIGRSDVEPIGWEPTDRAYRAVVVGVPLPPAEVQLDPSEPSAAASGDAGAVYAAIRSAIATAGPDGGPSTGVRVVDADTASPGALRLRVSVPAAGHARIARADGTAVVGDVADAGGAGARLVASRLEHIAGWELVRALGDHPSPLAGLVDLDVFAAGPGETRVPDGRSPLPSDGSLVLTYGRQQDGSWLAPAVFMQLRSAAERDLFVAVLDLTDRFRCHPVVPTVKLAAGHVLALNDGGQVSATLPDGVPVEPGRSVRDWLKVIVSDVDFEATSFTMQQLDAPPLPATRGVPRSTLDRLAAKAARRDVRTVEVGGSTPVAQWTASTLVLEVRVPT
jgi:Caspase domain